MNAAVNTLSITQPGIANHPVVTPERWIAERKKLLAREKELTHLRDQMAEQRPRAAVGAHREGVCVRHAGRQAHAG